MGEAGLFVPDRSAQRASLPWGLGTGPQDVSVVCAWWLISSGITQLVRQIVLDVWPITRSGVDGATVSPGLGAVTPGAVSVMTTARRGRRTSRPRRSVRRVWVNDQISLGGNAINTVILVDLLAAASDFMVFDSTILAVRISHLLGSFTSSSSTVTNTIAAALMVGNENLDVADIVDRPRAGHIGPPWLWHSSVALRTGSVAIQNFNLVSSTTGGILVKAKRRLTENNQTLWLIVDSNMGGSETDFQIDGYFRTLILIP